MIPQERNDAVSGTVFDNKKRCQKQRVRKGHVEFVNHAVKELRKVVDREAFASIALPRLATGAGGLKWADVEPLVQHHLGTLKIPVYIYVEYLPGHAAEELQVAK